MSEETTNQTAAENSDEGVERAVGALFGLGRVWAGYGLRIGRTALETSALSLRTTAELLDAISDRVDPPADEADAPAAG